MVWMECGSWVDNHQTYSQTLKFVDKRQAC